MRLYKHDSNKLDFNPKTLRVVELRRIFLFHDVDFPSSAKKSDLVDIFQSQIAPRASAFKRSIGNSLSPTNTYLEPPRRVVVSATIVATF